MKTKSFHLLMILFLLFSMLLLVSCNSNIEINTQYSYSNAESYLVGNGSFDASTIKHIDIDWISGNIIIDRSSDNNISFIEEIDENLSDDLKLHYFLNGNTLYIKFAKATKLLSFNGNKKNLYIKIPSSIVLDSFFCNMVSANITIKNLNADTVHIDSVSGIIYNYNVTSKFVTLDSTSGNIMAKGLISKELSIDSTSGKVTLENVNCEEIDIETTSGDISTTNVETLSLSADSSSSVVTLRFKTIPTEVEVSTISGDIYLFLPKETKFMMNYDTVSGEFTHTFALSKSDSNLFDYSTEDPSSKVIIESISGNLDIDYSN